MPVEHHHGSAPAPERPLLVRMFIGMMISLASMAGLVTLAALLIFATVGGPLLAAWGLTAVWWEIRD